MATSCIAKRFGKSLFQSITRPAHPAALCSLYSTRPETSQADSLIDIGTRQIFTEEHDIFRENVRRFFKDELAPHQDRWERQGHVDKDIFWRKLGQQGYLGIDVPVELGGIGGDFISSTIVIEEQMYLGYIGTSLYVHSEVVIPYIRAYGTTEQKQKFLPRLVQGEAVGAVAMTEPSAGSDLQGIKTYAKKDGDDWILNGSKILPYLNTTWDLFQINGTPPDMDLLPIEAEDPLKFMIQPSVIQVFISNGYLADLVIVAAITDLESTKKAHGISLFLVEAGTPGFNKGRLLEKIGEKSADAAELFFEDVRLPSSSILGGEAGINKGFYKLMEQLPRERLTIGLGGLAMAEAVFEMTRDYVKKRRAFGKTLSKLQTVQHRLASLKTQLCVNRAFTDMATQMYQDGRLDTVTASMVKYSNSDLTVKVCDEGVQLHGGWGYMWEYPVARAFCVARVMPIVGGTNEIMKEVIARDIVRD